MPQGQYTLADIKPAQIGQYSAADVMNLPPGFVLEQPQPKVNLPPGFMLEQGSVPMIAPDGTPGYVPANRVQDALQAGGKQGVTMLAPDGTRGIVPLDQAQAAIKAGGQLIGGPVPEPQFMRPEYNQQGGYGPISRSDLVGSLFANSDTVGRRAALVLAPEAASIGTAGLPLAARALAQAAAGYAGGRIAGLSKMESAGTGAIAAAIPVAGAALDALPTTAKAGQLFNSVAQDANKVPVQLNYSQDAALRLVDWSKKTNLGPTINKFLQRISGPNQGPLTYEEGRQWYNLLGKLSADETSKLAPAIQRDLREMVSGLRTDIGDAAAQVGRGQDYYSALGQYRRASQINNAKQAVMQTYGPAAAKGAAYALGVGGVGGVGYKLYQLLTGK